jgi:hypothetical protein
MNLSINLKITNNIGAELPISILGVIQNQDSFNNINTVYEFDLSGETLNSVLFVFAYSTIAQPSVNIQYFFNNPTPTIQGYVDDLNTLNVGYFTYYGTTIYMLSNNYIGKSIKI